MKNSLFLLLFIFTCIHAIEARSLQGLCVEDGRMYYFMDRKLYCQQIDNDRILHAVEPNADTAIVNILSGHMIKSLNITTDSAKAIARKRIGYFYAMNVSVHHHSVFLGVRFMTENNIHSKMQYASLEFDDKLAFRDFYIVRAPELFTMPVFHALQFKDDNTVFMPSLTSDKTKIGIGYYEFVFDKAHHRLHVSDPVVSDLKIYKAINIMNTQRIIDPVLYVVPNSNTDYYFHHPYPILYDRAGKIIYEPYYSRVMVDSIYGEMKKKGEGRDYSYDAGFTGAYHNYGNIILASAEIDSTLYMVVSNKKNENITELASYNLSTGEQKIIFLPVPFKNSYFVFSGKDLYILDYSKGEGRIIIKVL